MHHHDPVRNEVAPGLKKYDNRDAWFYRTFLCLCANCEEELDQMYAALHPQAPSESTTTSLPPMTPDKAPSRGPAEAPGERGSAPAPVTRPAIADGGRAEVPCAGIGLEEVGCLKVLHLARHRTVWANEDDTLAYRCSDCGQAFCLSCLRLHSAARKEQATDAVEAELTGYMELDEALNEQAPGKDRTYCPRHGIDACPDDCPVPMVLPGVKREQAPAGCPDDCGCVTCPECHQDVPHQRANASGTDAGDKGVSERTGPDGDADPLPNPAGPRTPQQLSRDGLVANQPPAGADEERCRYGELGCTYTHPEKCPKCGASTRDHTLDGYPKAGYPYCPKCGWEELDRPQKRPAPAPKLKKRVLGRDQYGRPLLYPGPKPKNNEQAPDCIHTYVGDVGYCSRCGASEADASDKGVSERTVPGRDADPPPNPAGPRTLGQLARDNLLANQPPAPAPKEERWNPCEYCGKRHGPGENLGCIAAGTPAPKEKRCPECRHSHAGTERCGVIGRTGRVCACPVPTPKADRSCRRGCGRLDGHIEDFDCNDWPKPKKKGGIR